MLSDAVTLQARDGIRYTSKEMLRIEQEISEIAEQKQLERHDVNRESLQQIADKKTLSREQRQMVEHVTTGGGVRCVEGMAGTGKSYALGAAREVWQNSGYNVVGLAPTAKAAAGLQDGAGIESKTIHLQLALMQHGKARLDDKTIIVVDEAGMCGSRLVNPLLRAAHAAGAKVVFVGDSKQLQPVDAGGAFRLLSSRLGAAELTDIRRQKVAWQKEAVLDFAAGDAGKALAAFKERGALKIEQNVAQAQQKMVHDWHCAPEKAPDKIMLAASNAEVKNLNELARTTWKNEGKLSDHFCVVAGKEFAENERLVFLKNDRKLGLQNGTRATLQRVDIDERDTKLTVLTDEGKQITFSAKDYENFTYGYAMTCHKAQGMTVDKCFFAVHETMSDKEWSYVAASRAREETTIYATSELQERLERTMSASHQKETSLDFVLQHNEHTSQHEIHDMQLIEHLDNKQEVDLELDFD